MSHALAFSATEAACLADLAERARVRPPLPVSGQMLSELRHLAGSHAAADRPLRVAELTVEAQLFALGALIDVASAAGPGEDSRVARAALRTLVRYLRAIDDAASTRHA